MAQGPAEQGQKELKTEWPVTEGTTFETTETHKRNIKLIPTEGSIVLSRNKVLI